jgi:hypothetical protein
MTTSGDGAGMGLPCLALLATMCMLAVNAVAADNEQLAPQIVPVDRVWSAHPVQFGLADDDRMLVLAYYDANRQLTLASRPKDDPAGWRYHRLPSWTGWDSHNSLAVAIDGAGHVHVIGNLHNDPLLYFRSELAGDLRTMQPVRKLVDPTIEQRMTYPEFLRRADGSLVLKYRDGGSGNGSEIYDVYSEQSRSWSRLLDTPLLDGEGARSGYPVGPVRGPDGRFHLVWVWRDTPDASTNHHLSYAVSSDLRHWQRSDGTPLALPIRLAAAEIVDPVPAGGGMINNNTIPGFDAAGRIVLAYHKYDASGDTQVYVARREASGWRIVQASAWKGFRWDFAGEGSLQFRVAIDLVVLAEDGRLEIHVRRDGVMRRLILDERTLELLADRKAGHDPLAGRVPVPTGMQLNTVQAGTYALAWPTLGPNRDVPSTALPPATVLYLIENQP